MPFPKPSPAAILAQSVASTSRSLTLAIEHEKQTRAQVRETLRLLCGESKRFTPSEGLEVTPSDSHEVYTLQSVRILDGREAAEEGKHAADGFAAVFLCTGRDGDEWSIGVPCFELEELARILAHLTKDLPNE